MHRIGSLALILVLAPLLVVAASSQSSPAPTIDFSWYAPAQKDSPVQIVGFEHDQSKAWFVLSNTSDKSVVAVTIGFVDIVPRGCSIAPSSEPYFPEQKSSAGGFKVGIVPHGRGIAENAGIQMIGGPPSPSFDARPEWPQMTVEAAKFYKAGYMQVQFGITGVLFQDGTSWPAQVAFLLRDDFDSSSKTLSPDEVEAQHALTPSRPFDRSLADAEAGKCADVMAAANALQSVEEVVFKHESSHHDNEGAHPPRLRFSCSLEGSKAVCRFPLAQAQTRDSPSR
jgi:hypothetical protein